MDSTKELAQELSGLMDEFQNRFIRLNESGATLQEALDFLSHYKRFVPKACDFAVRAIREQHDGVAEDIDSMISRARSGDETVLADAIRAGSDALLGYRSSRKMLSEIGQEIERDEQASEGK